MDDLQNRWDETVSSPPPAPPAVPPVPSTDFVASDAASPSAVVPTGPAAWTKVSNYVQAQAAAYPTLTNGYRWLQGQVMQFVKSSLRYALVLFGIVFLLLRCLAPQFLYYRSPNKDDPPRFAWDKAAFISLAVAVGYVLLPYGYQLVKYFLLA